MWLVYCGEWDAENCIKKFNTLEELQEWLEFQNTPIEHFHFYHKMPDDWMPLF